MNSSGVALNRYDTEWQDAGREGESAVLGGLRSEGEDVCTSCTGCKQSTYSDMNTCPADCISERTELFLCSSDNKGQDDLWLVTAKDLSYYDIVACVYQPAYILHLLAGP